MDASDLLATMKRTIEQLAAYNEIAKALTSTLEVREVLSLVMQKVSALLRPKNWSLLLEDEQGLLYFELCVGPGSEKLKDLRFNPGEGIAGAVFVSGEARLVANASGDPTFSRRFDASSEFKTQSILAVPLKAKGRVLGVIELVHDSSDRMFTQEDMQAASTIADYAAIALENARIVQKLQELTLTDEHTGLHNARHLRALLDREVNRSHRFHHPVSLIFLDLDGFKNVNDTHGHLVGSALLREVGVLLNGTIRQVDFAFRYGGDEFAVLLVETGPTHARMIGERIRDRFREKLFLPDQGLNIRLTASVGVATCPDNALDAIDLLRAADSAMYRVKAEGRNEVQVAEPLKARGATAPANKR